MTLLRHTYFVTGRHLRALVRQPWVVAISVVQPVIWLVLFSALFSSATQIPGFRSVAGGSYLDYLVPGVVVMTALFSSGWSGMGIIEDLDRGIMDGLLISPIPRGALIAGRTLYEMLALLAQVAIIGALALGLGAHFAGGLLGFAVLTGCAMLVCATFASISDAFALLLQQRESVIGINSFLVLPLSFLSTAFMPLDLAPAWMSTVAACNPVNWAVVAGRESLLASPDWALIAPRLAGLLAVTLLAGWWATLAFRAYQRSI